MLSQIFNKLVSQYRVIPGPRQVKKKLVWTYHGDEEASTANRSRLKTLLHRDFVIL